MAEEYSVLFSGFEHEMPQISWFAPLPRKNSKLCSDICEYLNKREIPTPPNVRCRVDNDERFIFMTVLPKKQKKEKKKPRRKIDSDLMAMLA